MPITITITTEVERLMDLHDMIPFLIDAGIPEHDIVLGGHESPLFIEDALGHRDEIAVLEQRIHSFEADMTGMTLMLAEERAKSAALQAELSGRIRDEAEERDYAEWRYEQQQLAEAEARREADPYPYGEAFRVQCIEMIKRSYAHGTSHCLVGGLYVSNTALAPYVEKVAMAATFKATPTSFSTGRGAAAEREAVKLCARFTDMDLNTTVGWLLDAGCQLAHESSVQS